jgi:erythronate-4-phosphate dehydrogenase
MKIIADSNIPALDGTFCHHGEVSYHEGRNICHADLTDADVLLVRSITRVGEDLLRGTNVRFVGSTTIGIDHLDTAWLEANNIAWAHAPGSNADAAAQYTLAMMWLTCDRLDQDFRQQSVGIIGRGNVGRRLEHLLKALDIRVMCCDPPLQDAGAQQLVSMADACSNNIISLHVPLTASGKYPTRNLFDSEQMASLEPDTLLINASRGGVIEGFGLLEHLLSGQIHAALDVWPDEPYIDPQLLKLVSVATPHVAGYSREGKLAGTRMIYASFCETFGIATNNDTAGTKTEKIGFPPALSRNEILRRSVMTSSQVERDDRALRNLSPAQVNDSRLHIDSLRATYPERHEFKSYTVSGVSDTCAKQFQRLGFITG